MYRDAKRALLWRQPSYMPSQTLIQHIGIDCNTSKPIFARCRVLANGRGLTFAPRAVLSSLLGNHAVSTQSSQLDQFLYKGSSRVVLLCIKV